MLQATCTKCGETFNPADADDLEHVETMATGAVCGGMGTLERVIPMSHDEVHSEYAATLEEIASVTREIDAKRAAPFADDTEYRSQMADISFLQLRRRKLRARASGMLASYAARIARGGE